MFSLLGTKKGNLSPKEQWRLDKEKALYGEYDSLNERRTLREMSQLPT